MGAVGSWRAGMGPAGAGVVMARELRLSGTEFEVAWESLRLGDLPLIFRVCLPRAGDTDEERSHLVRTTLEGLRGRGLADDRGLHEDLVDALGLLARPGWVVDARLDTYRPLRALGAAAGRNAVVAVLTDDTVTISASTPFRLAADMAALAAEHPPASGTSINLSVEVLLAAAERVVGADPLRLADELVRRGVSQGDARMLAQVNAELVGSGQFGVEVADPDAGLRRAGRVVGFSDTRAGRWAQLRTAAHGGTQWVTFTPAGIPQLAAMITELLAECGVRPV